MSPWSAFSDSHFDEMARLGLSQDALLLEVQAVVFSNRAGSDGAIPRQVLRRITNATAPEDAASELVEAGLWTATAAGWQVVDWDKTQLSASEVKKRAEESRFRAKRSRRHKAGDHDLCLPTYCARAPHQTRDGGGTFDAGASSLPSRPALPSRKAREGQTGRVTPLARATAQAPPPASTVSPDWEIDDRTGGD